MSNFRFYLLSLVLLLLGSFIQKTLIYSQAGGECSNTGKGQYSCTACDASYEGQNPHCTKQSATVCSGEGYMVSFSGELGTMMKKDTRLKGPGTSVPCLQIVRCVVSPKVDWETQEIVGQMCAFGYVATLASGTVYEEEACP